MYERLKMSLITQIFEGTGILFFFSSDAISLFYGLNCSKNADFLCVVEPDISGK